MLRFLASVCLLTLMTASTAMPESLSGIEYSRAGDIPLLLDAQIPEGKGPFPAVILVHGGAWVGGNRQRGVQSLFEPLAKAGFAWFSIDYRLARDFLQFSAGAQDVEEGIRFVRRRAADLHIDPTRIILIGESAGAHLASLAALNGSGGDIRAVVAFFCPSDLVDLARTSPMIPQAVRDAVTGTPFADLVLARLRRSSPAGMTRKDMPPFLLIHGTADTVVPYAQSPAWRDRIREAGGSCELYTVEGGGHGLRGLARADATRAYERHMIDWLKRQITTDP